jgi:anti-anti-sigma factor
MDLTEETLGEVLVLVVKGRLDNEAAPALGGRLTEAFAASGKRLVLDLRQLEYINSAGFRALLLAAKRAEETGSRFVVCGLSGMVRQLFELGGFLNVFRILGSREEAISAAR